jgi:hypothetical protein
MGTASRLGTIFESKQSVPAGCETKFFSFAVFQGIPGKQYIWAYISSGTVLINTLQRSASTRARPHNRFSGFQSDCIAAEVRKTAEAVASAAAAHDHPAEAGC